jgi:hypothetical protein
MNTPNTNTWYLLSTAPVNTVGYLSRTEVLNSSVELKGFTIGSGRCLGAP